MNLKINTDVDLFFIQLLELFSSFVPINRLRKADRLVLAEIMKQHYIYRAVKKHHARRNLVFSQDIKQEMCDNLGIKRQSFNNSLASLRREGILDKNNDLDTKFFIFPEDEFTFGVTFKINEKKTEDTRG